MVHPLTLIIGINIDKSRRKILVKGFLRGMMNKRFDVARNGKIISTFYADGVLFYLWFL